MLQLNYVKGLEQRDQSVQMAEGAAILQARIELERQEDLDDQENSALDDAHRVYYPSNSLESAVVNAVSGKPYPFAVGSLASLRLFHVTDATGAINSAGVAGEYNREPNHLYYDNPQQYMRHRGGRHGVSRQDVGSWERKVARLFPNPDSLEPDPEALADVRREYRARLAEQRRSAIEREAARQADLLRREARATADAERKAEIAAAAAENRRRARNDERAAERNKVAASRREKRYRKRQLARARGSPPS